MKASPDGSKIAVAIKEMNLFESKFKNSLKSNVSLLDRIMHYIIKRKGKQMRPMFVFLSAKLFGNFEENTYRAASMIELYANRIKVKQTNNGFNIFI